MSWYCPRCKTHITNVPKDKKYQCDEMMEECKAVLNSEMPGGITHTFRDPLLVERQKTHGDFALNAQISQSLKSTFRAYMPLEKEYMKHVHKEALDMIALKLSRILSGQADFKDHWDDIAGYAKLASEACQKS